jgi:carbon-monoxide dehydrogenase large subunit
VPALAVIINAIVDALSEFGVRHIEMPATPERVWQAIAEAKRKRALNLKMALIYPGKRQC